MKILFFSDIHGVPETLETLLQYAERLQPDRLVLLGDVLYHGPRNGVPNAYDPQRVAALLNQHKEAILAVRGNCDTEVDQMMLDFPILADYSEIWTETTRFFLTHGHRWNESHLPPLSPGTVLVHGHTHLPRLEVGAEGVLVFNPGSLSLPKGGHPRTFGLLDENQLAIHRLNDGTRYGDAVTFR